jgi:hypothetical protein
MLTEAQAREKWCPLSRPGRMPGNRFGDDARGSAAETQTRCIASQCMAWRRHEIPEQPRLHVGCCGLAGHDPYPSFNCR